MRKGECERQERQAGKMVSYREGAVLTSRHLMQALAAAGANHNVVYLSVPITSGEREIRLLDELGLRSAEELRAQHQDRWRREVVAPNEEAAACHAAAVRHAPWAAGDLVVDPSHMHVPGWDQADYNGFWIALMRRHVRRVVATPGWEFSQGSRIEVAYALGLSLKVLEVTGSEFSADQLQHKAEDAAAELARRGWSTAQIDAYLPKFDRNIHPVLRPSAQTEVFSWLAEERTHRVARFGPSADDAHVRINALDPNGWWTSQLRKYWEESRQLGLDAPEGRLALAKYLATACALLESAVRVYGSLPGTTQDNPNSA
jgi:hypothetical protein